MRHFHLSRKAAALSMSLVMVLVAAGAFGGAHAEEQNTIQLHSGETLEIATEAMTPGADFSWILTKDRKFLSGQRSRFFQTRLTEIGTYTLDVSIQNPSTGENSLRTFTLIVNDPVPPALPPESNIQESPLRVSVSTQPAAINNIVYLPPQGGLVKIDSSQSQGKIEKYSIDLDTLTDSDNDGNPANDRDNAGTLSEKAGSPIYFYAIPKPQPRSIRVSVNDLTGTQPSSIDLPLSFSVTPSIPSSATPPLQDGNGPIMIEQKDLTITTKIKTDDPMYQGRQLLYEWDFGDRSRSLLTSPTHTYASAGTYVLTVTVRDIATAEVVQSISATVQVSEATPSASSSSPSSSASSSSAQTSSGSSFSIGSVIKVVMIILLLLALAMGLYFLLTWIKKRTTTSIQKTLEKMEETIIKKEPEATDESAPAPMKLKKDVVDVVQKTTPLDVIEREKSQREFQTKERTNETPVTSAGPVPPWLKNAGGSNQKPAEPAAKPVTPPAPAPKLAPEPPAPAAPASAEGPVPSWLKPQPETPKPAPTPAPAPAPAPQEKPAPRPAPVPAPEQKPGTAAASPKPAAAPPPPPPKPKIAPAPQPAPTPAPAPASQPAPTPAPAPAPKPVVQPAPAKQNPAPAERPKASVPAGEAKTTGGLSSSGEVPKANPPEPKKPDDSDPTVAIIQADSLIQ